MFPYKMETWEGGCSPSPSAPPPRAIPPRSSVWVSVTHTLPTLMLLQNHTGLEKGNKCKKEIAYMAQGQKQNPPYSDSPSPSYSSTTPPMTITAGGRTPAARAFSATSARVPTVTR